MPFWSKQRKLYKLLIILFWVVAWQLCAVALDNEIVLVGPVDTAAALLVLVRKKDFWFSVLNTFIRIASGFVAASTEGVILGITAAGSRLLRDLLEPLVALMKSIPVASFAILAIIWLGGSARLSSFVAFVVVFPMVYLSTISGLMSTDKRLLEMAEVFRVGRIKKILYIYLPALLPYLINCFKTALSMGWKSGVAAELIGQPVNTIGGNLYQAKIFLDTASLFAWTFVIILISSLFEWAVLCIFTSIEKRRGM